MDIVIDPASETPIYRQIYEQLSAEIMRGELVSGDCLPPIRVVAKELRISVITTKRAYDELEAAGLIYTLPGKGSFVAAADASALRREQEREIQEKLRQIHALAAQCGMSADELWNMYDNIKEEGQ